MILIAILWHTRECKISLARWNFEHVGARQDIRQNHGRARRLRVAAKAITNKEMMAIVEIQTAV
jgi:hypothetical protein